MKRYHWLTGAVLGAFMSLGWVSTGWSLTAQDVAAHSTLTTITAKVVDVHHHSQKLTLEGPQGNQWMVKVDGKVKNFKNIKKGDEVKVQYYDSIAWEILKKQSGETPSKAVVDVKETAPPGGKPGADEVEVTKINAIVEKIDKANSSVTLKGPEKSITFKVKDAKALEAVKVGDQVAVTHTEAWAVSVEPAAK